MKIMVILVIITIIGLSLAVIPQLSQITQMGSNWRKDDKLIPILQEISKFIPENESIVTSSFNPTLVFFIDRQLEVPKNISSYNSLVESMKSHNNSYLLIIDGEYNIPRRDIQFNSSQFALEKDFREIATYSTDFSKLHLYKLILIGN